MMLALGKGGRKQIFQTALVFNDIINTLGNGGIP